ncbi:MAG: carbamoyltransferase HypF [Myxococcales bacterium]
MTIRRLAITVRGIVQGVGFRPFVYRVATELSLAGYVLNRSDGVRIEVEGAAETTDRFVTLLKTAAPAQAVLESVSVEEIAPGGDSTFEIRASDASAKARPTVPADLATCPECLAEISTAGERRFGYPFTNCTNCGPRYSIIESLPYDRPRTSMKGFQFCPDCEREYRDPLDRRFHAQPVACPTCGPELRLCDGSGHLRSSGEAALREAALAVRSGSIVALKGLGGFQLVTLATRSAAVVRLRERKHREAKPFAVMFASPEQLREHAQVSEDEAVLLRSPQAPIVLVRVRKGTALAPEVAPANPRVGAMLPYTPLHRLLLDLVGEPIICTSGNLSDEPMCTDDDEALSRLHAIADLFLLHDRPIVRPVDDSVLRVDTHGPVLLRRARGYAPRPLPFPAPAPCILAVGAHLKNTIALTVGDQIVVSQHLGDLDSAEGAALHERTILDLVKFFEVKPGVVACDLHPDYASTRCAERLAQRWGAKLERVQHHHAHVAAVMAEHPGDGPVLGLAWDGTGLGDDGTVWGGEALVCEGASYRRLFPLRPFRLPGGDLAAREPRRVALGLLHALGIDPGARLASQFQGRDLENLTRALSSGLNAPESTSIGRLFDGIAALCGLRGKSLFEGQAAMEARVLRRRRERRRALPLPARSRVGPRRLGAADPRHPRRRRPRRPHRHCERAAPRRPREPRRRARARERNPAGRPVRRMLPERAPRAPDSRLARGLGVPGAARPARPAERWSHLAGPGSRCRSARLRLLNHPATDGACPGPFSRSTSHSRWPRTRLPAGQRGRVSHIGLHPA